MNRSAATGKTNLASGKPAGNTRKDESASQPDSGRHAIDEHALHAMVATAAYYLSEQRGFAPGAELEDWLQAEAQVAAQSG